MEKRHIVDIKVLGLAKIRKDKIAGKRYVCVLFLSLIVYLEFITRHETTLQ